MIARRHFRYSIRRLFFLVTLVCLVATIWPWCRSRAISDVSSHAGGYPAEVVAPFLLRAHFSDNVTARDTLHAWAFGRVFPLPFHSEYPEPNPVIITVQPRIIYQSEPEQLNLGL